MHESAPTHFISSLPCRRCGSPAAHFQYFSALQFAVSVLFLCCTTSSSKRKEMSRTRMKATRNRGAALIVALALTLCLTMVVVGTQIQVVTQLRAEKGQ